MRTLHGRLLVLYALVALVAIFYLPTLVPLHPTASISYLFGYDNRTAVVLLVLFAALGAFWTRGLNFPFLPPAHPSAVSRKSLGIALAAVFVGWLFMTPFASTLGGLGEFSYEFDRLTMVAHGATPCTGIEWPYGVSFLYGPLFLVRIFAMSLVNAYLLYWLLTALAGTWILYEVVQRIDYPTPARTAIFWILFVAGYISTILSMGLMAGYLRFNLPLLLLLVIYRMASRPTASALPLAAGLAVACTAVMIVVSPEMAIAHAFAAGCALLLSARPPRRFPYLPLGGYAAGCVIVFLVAVRLHLFDTLFDDAGGAISIPIAPAPHFVLFFAAVFLCACAVVRFARQPLLANNTLVLIAFGLPMLAAALGRCDPFHVLLDGEAILLPCLFYLSNSRKLWQWTRPLFACFFILLPGLTFLWYYVPSIAHIGLAIYSQTDSSTLKGRTLSAIGKVYIAHQSSPEKRAKWEAHLAHAREDAVPTVIDFDALYPNAHGEFFAPFGYMPSGIGTYYSSRIDYGYYNGLTDAYTPHAVQRQIEALARNPRQALLLPDYFTSNRTTDPAGARAFLSLIYAFPYLGKVRHTESIYQPLCDYIQDHYTQVQAPEMRNFNYGLWVLKQP